MPDFDLKDHAQLTAWLMKSSEPAARRGMLSAGKRIINVIITEIIPNEPRKPVDRGLYRAGFRAERTADGNVTIRNIAPHAAIIEYGARAENIKIGRAMIDALAEWVVRKRIGQGAKVSTPAAASGKAKIQRPKKSKIGKAVRKLKQRLAAAVGKSLLFVGGVSGSDIAKAEKLVGQHKAQKSAAKTAMRMIEARRIAWAIAKSMKKKGIFNEGKGLHIMGKGMQRAPQIIEEEIIREIKRGLGKG